MRTTCQIAIDGPVAAGKGTISRLLAEKLGFLYVDTGAMYRATALLAIRNQISFDDETELVSLIEKNQIDMRNPQGEKEQDGRLTTILLNGEDISWLIRTPAVSDGASRVAVLPEVRKALVKKQQQFAESQNVIMEGRDITFRVLPDADLKIFLTANLSTRAKRRHMEYLSKGIDKEFDEVISEITQRDARDTQRDVDPLHVTADAWNLDTSDLDIEQVVDLIAERVQNLPEKNCQKN